MGKGRAGPNGNLYPWGNDFDSSKANYDRHHSATLPVDAHPEGVGADALAGQVGVGDVIVASKVEMGAAFAAAERLVRAGVTSILNFAPVVLSVPRSIEVRKVDLAVELQILSYHEQREWEAMEATILAAEERLGAARAALEDPAIASDADELARRLGESEAAGAEVERLYARWSELEAKRG